MKNTLVKAIRFWMILFMATCTASVAIGYILTQHQFQHLSQLISDNAKQLATPALQDVPTVRQLQPSPPVDELLSDIMQRYPIAVHYERSSDSSERWIVTVEAQSQLAMQFVANVIGSQAQKYSRYPDTESLHWKPLKQRENDVYGILQWQFRWQGESSAPTVEKSLYTHQLAPIKVPTLSCHDKPYSGLHPGSVFAKFTDADLTAIQTTPIRKAVFTSKNQTWTTASEGDWLGQHTQLDSINRDHLTVLHWQPSGNCWHKHSQQLSINKESDAS